MTVFHQLLIITGLVYSYAIIAVFNGNCISLGFLIFLPPYAQDTSNKLYNLSGFPPSLYIGQWAILCDF